MMHAFRFNCSRLHYNTVAIHHSLSKICKHASNFKQLIVPVRFSSGFNAYISWVGIITGSLNPIDDSISAILVFLKEVKQLAEN